VDNPVPAQYLPAGHCVGAPYPPGQYEPAGQFTAAVRFVLPVPGKYVPGSHGVHFTALDVDEYVPAGHGSTPEVVLGQYVPGEHDLHVVDTWAPTVAEVFPVGHGVG